MPRKKSIAPSAPTDSSPPKPDFTDLSPALSDIAWVWQFRNLTGVAYNAVSAYHEMPSMVPMSQYFQISEIEAAIEWLAQHVRAAEDLYDPHVAYRVSSGPPGSGVAHSNVADAYIEARAMIWRWEQEKQDVKTVPKIPLSPLRRINSLLTSLPPEWSTLPSPEELMDRFFYEELCKSKKLSGTNQQILDRAKKEHPDWPCPGSIQDMRYRAGQYQKSRSLPPIPKRNAAPKQN